MRISPKIEFSSLTTDNHLEGLSTASQKLKTAIHPRAAIEVAVEVVVDNQSTICTDMKILKRKEFLRK